MKLLKKNYDLSLWIIPIFFAWLVCTLFVDIIAVPTVFKLSTRIEDAGKIGMSLFKTFNKWELFLSSTVLFIYLLSPFKKNPLSLVFILFVVLWIFPLTYLFYFTPQITYYGTMLRSGVTDANVLIKLQEMHTMFHQLYKILDLSKMILIVLAIYLSKKHFHGDGGER